MKFVIAIFALSISLPIFAATPNPQECLKQKRALDRRYCLDSYLETVKETYATERQTMAKGMPAKSKADKVAMTEQEITARKDYLNMMKTEIELQEKYLEELKAAKIAATAAPKPAKKEKKEKKDKGFRIKL